MPRLPREKSTTGIYHIILRGINQQVIFEDEEDYSKFIETLGKYKAVSEYKIYAYCLMSNHIHILLKTGKEDLEQIIKRIAGSYVYWYNWKYYRRGHLFQDRFRSEPIEDNSYFMSVLRYIHQNPVKVGLVKSVGEYQYSSYGDYEDGESQIIDTEFVLSIMKREEFVSWINEYEDVECLDDEKKVFRLSDNDAREIIKKISKCDNATEFQKLEISKRDMFIKKFKLSGLSIRQISRLTGVSFAIVRKI